MRNPHQPRCRFPLRIGAFFLQMVALERAPEPGWEGQEESLGILHLASLAGVFSSTHLQGFGQAEFGSSNFPFKRRWNVGAGRFCSSWPGRESGGLFPHPPTPNSQGTGGGGGPHTNWALGLDACGEGLPRPSRPKDSPSSASLRPALLLGAEAPKLSERRHSSSQCSSVWLLSQDPSPPGPEKQAPSLPSAWHVLLSPFPLELGI